MLLSERIRPDAASTLRYFAEQGVAVKVISGDHPATAAAIGATVGLSGAESPVDARTMPSDSDRLGELLERRSVFGRVTPEQKHAFVAAPQSSGHVVAMVGDGVNDVLALKGADTGVAMGSGSSATRAVAQVVLLDNTFAALPSVIAEGRRVIANIERLANLFLTKTVYAFLLAVAVGVAGFPFPFLPRQLTIVGSLSIGIPAFSWRWRRMRSGHGPASLGGCFVSRYPPALWRQWPRLAPIGSSSILHTRPSRRRGRWPPSCSSEPGSGCSPCWLGR
ncbi:MAG TPA: HAD-IC family P-type ATPase [Candidatus Dormibacteraeota bacterium]